MQGYSKEHIPLTLKRLTGIVSRGGAIMAGWCTEHDEESFLYTHFEEICQIAARYERLYSPSAMAYALAASMTPTMQHRWQS